MTEDELNKLEKETPYALLPLITEIRRLTSGRKVWADPHSLAEMDELGVEVYPVRMSGDVEYYLVPVETK